MSAKPLVAKWFAVYGLAGALVGCDNAEIQHHRVSKPPQSAKQDSDGDKPTPRVDRPAVSAPPQRDGQLSYKAPADWQPMPDTSGMRAAGFLVGSGTAKAEMTVIPLAGAAGGLVSNVNRWRSQIGLEPVDEAQLKREVQPITVGGVAGQAFDIVGPESAGPKRERILVALVEQGGRTWFFKMKGPVDVVAAQKTAFEDFVKSVQLQ